MKKTYTEKLAAARDKEVRHWQRVITKLEKRADKRGYSIDAERQELALARHNIAEIREQWRKDGLAAVSCNGVCDPPAMSYNKDCPLHGW